MAVIRSKSSNIVVSLSPHELEEGHNPPWIRNLFSLAQQGREIASAMISLTDNDMAEVIENCRLALDTEREFSFTSTDEDFILTITSGSLPADVYVSFWVGEPYQLMRGWRFVAPRAELKAFGDQLRDEVGRVG